MTAINPITYPQELNLLNVGELLEYINDRRQENNSDFLDDNKLIRFINSAINELNQENKYFFKEKMVEATINTETQQWYSFASLVTDGDMKKPQEIRLVDGTIISEPLTIGIDYSIEPSPTLPGKGIRFISSVDSDIQILYWAYIPKITEQSEYIDIPFEFMNFFVEKVLQYTFEGESRYDKADRYKLLADITYSNLRQDNREQDVNDLGLSPYFVQ